MRARQYSHRIIRKLLHKKTTRTLVTAVKSCQTSIQERDDLSALSCKMSQISERKIRPLVDISFAPSERFAVYRISTRSPEEIKAAGGFIPRGPGQQFYSHKLNHYKHEPFFSSYVSTSFNDEFQKIWPGNYIYKLLMPTIHSAAEYVMPELFGIPLFVENEIGAISAIPVYEVISYQMKLRQRTEELPTLENNLPSEQLNPAYHSVFPRRDYAVATLSLAAEEHALLQNYLLTTAYYKNKVFFTANAARACAEMLKEQSAKYASNSHHFFCVNHIDIVAAKKALSIKSDRDLTEDELLAYVAQQYHGYQKIIGRA